MSVAYIVQRGDCLSSIAASHGVTWQTLWDFADNADLRRLRKDPNILLISDIVHIPARMERNESAATGTVNHFEAAAPEPTTVRLRLVANEDEPRADVECALTTGTVTASGRTDADGFVEFVIDPTTRQGMLRVGDSALGELYDLRFGELDPIAELTGIQQRLKNLGFDPGQIDGLDGPRTQAAVRAFQERNSLVVDGIAGHKTQAALRSAHGS